MGVWADGLHGCVDGWVGWMNGCMGGWMNEWVWADG